MADYGRLKWADDKRWTNVRKRGTYKALAEASNRTNDAQWLADDEATAERLADAKLSTAALYQALGARDDVVGHLLPDSPLTGRAAYCRMESAVAAERSLREKLVRGRHQLDECRHRVAIKTARLAQLKASVDAARDSVPTKPPRRPPVLESPLILDKKVDALKLGNLKAAKARDIIAKNTTMRDVLNEQLASDVRQQATAVVELLAYGTAAKQEAVTYNQEYCRVAGEHENSVRRNNAMRRLLDTRISVLESNRRKILINQIQNDSDEDIEFDTEHTMPSIVSDMETSNEQGEQNMMFLKDWIDTGQMEKQIFSVKENEELSNSSDVINPTASFTSSTTDSYIFPEEKVNLYKFRKGETSKAMEAVEYVCETLNFSDITEVLHYFTSVKNVEMRIKKMISTRKHILGVVQKDLESAIEVKMDSLNRLPEAILKLDANIEYVQREGLDVQKKQFDDVNRHITGYGVLFNELWFQLDNLVGKLERCHVPVVRKYQLHMKNPANKDTESMMDARQMLEGLRLKPCTVLDEDCTTVHEPSVVKSIDSAPGCRTVDVSGKNPAVDACRKLSETLYAKVKSCMVHIGGVFDANDRNQLMARACFAYDRQTQLQWDTVATKDRKRQARASLQLPVGKAKASVTDARATGIMTRVQAKQQAEDIVQWCITPKDTDDARRTRKPISFRQSRIVVPERKK
ncbi:uncharacterized protein LOC132934357 [Metopolophium dirhodum]|uniref:uncharacterized protein LOC132934357 n=1 Tax=Metopolophium dirhodum TaxID=44670 RepID=UPI00299006ED|nr:uncharacterized protein LOC132934357 [Metopolophium dirhodum]